MANSHMASPIPKDSVQEEEQLVEMLSRLNQVHLQLRQLRSTLPRMLGPLMDKQPSPQAAFAAYMQSVNSTTKEVTGFREAVRGLQSEGIFARAAASQQGNPKGIKPWRARNDPDWANPDPKRRRLS
ncbi:uncharacterized protein B0T15DRAFT_544157 [Chaetomium strumarium]|uniref:Uncharacterized protein n=1 Tax=Chaetomium strumarium TaxID=1170767 RepID=A0AAJ0GKI4_9PEZI|nr:hypothetical protein B0T15DRAFT_544157 [Chaetomium strumarium]